MKPLPLVLLALFGAHGFGQSPLAQPVAQPVNGVATYLVSTVQRMKLASTEFVGDTQEYAALIARNGSDYAHAYAAEGPEIRRLVKAMQENYKAMDSFGYETIEGIVAGVESLQPFDVYLDAGVPKGAGDPANVAPVTIKLSNGDVIDEEGSIFTYLVEPTLWGGTKKYVVPLDLNGDGVIAERESLPRSELLTAVGADLDHKLAELLAAAEAWKPGPRDCFAALVTMTPTLSDYFEDWKESRYAAQTSGRFYEVSRISDMEAIMKSCAVMYDAVNGEVSGQDPALARAIHSEFGEIASFLAKIETREKQGRINAAEIDELAARARSKTDKLVPQIKQAAALLNLEVNG